MNKVTQSNSQDLVTLLADGSRSQGTKKAVGEMAVYFQWSMMLCKPGLSLCLLLLIYNH